MNNILIRNCAFLTTMNEDRDELEDIDILVSQGIIREIGHNIAADTKTKIIDATRCIITPGLINTHDHLFQSLTKTVPKAQNASLFNWLKILYPIWGKMNPEQIFTATQLGLAELALSGCSLSADHMYIFQNGCRLDDSIEAASELGLRFNPTRGAMSVGESSGGLPPDNLIENEESILLDMERVVQKFNDTSEGSMLRVGLAPCSPFSVSNDLMRQSATLARKLGVRLHTHLAENTEDVKFSLEKYGCTPGEYVQKLGWVGHDVWHAHCVKLTEKEIQIFKNTSTGIAHCPCSNCRLGSGIAPIANMLKKGINIGLGVDGAASSDSSHLLNEARQSMLLQRLTYEGKKFSARNALEIATIGGARVLGRNDLGSIEIGKRADLALWKLDELSLAGTWDPIASLIFTGPHYVQSLIVEGKMVVEDGRLLSVSSKDIINKAKKSLKELMDNH